MGLFRSARLPRGAEILRWSDAARQRRHAVVMIAVAAVLIYVLFWIAAQKGAIYDDFLGPVVLTVTGLLLLVAPFWLFGSRRSEFTVLDAAGRRFLRIIDDASGELATVVRFSEVSEIFIERETVRESDGYSEVDHIRYSLLLRTRDGDRYLLAEPVQSTDLAFEEPPQLSALRDRLRTVVAGGP